MLCGRVSGFGFSENARCCLQVKQPVPGKEKWLFSLPEKRIRVKMLPAGDPLKAVRLGCDARREAIRIPGSRGVRMHE